METLRTWVQIPALPPADRRPAPSLRLVSSGQREAYPGSHIVGGEQATSIIQAMEMAQPELQGSGHPPSLCPASLWGPGTVCGPLWASRSTREPGPRAQLHPGPTRLLTRGRANVSEASKLFRRWTRCRCGGSRTDSGMLTLGAGAVDREGVALGASGPLWDPSPGPGLPSLKTGGPQAGLLSSVAAASMAAPGCPTCSGHSPDLRGLHQGLGAPLVPRCPAQAAGGARIRRHQKQAPVDAVTVHACGAVRSGSSLPPGARIPGPPSYPNHTGPPTPPPRRQPHAQAHTGVHVRNTNTHLSSRDKTRGTHTRTRAHTPINATRANPKHGSVRSRSQTHVRVPKLASTHGVHAHTCSHEQPFLTREART